MMKRPNKSNKDVEQNSLGGALRTFGGLLDFLSKLSDGTGPIERSGEITDDSGATRAVYGFSVRLGGDGSPKIEPFGNVKVGDAGTRVVETREPLVDVFDEEGLILIVAELPGVGADDVHYEVHGDILELKASHGERSYHKELLLPAVVDAPRATSSYRNGMFEIKLPKKA